MLEVAEPEFMAEDDLPIFANSVAAVPAARSSARARPEMAQRRHRWSGTSGPRPASKACSASRFRRNTAVPAATFGTTSSSSTRLHAATSAASPSRCIMAWSPLMWSLNGTEEQKYRWLPRLFQWRADCGRGYERAECRLGPSEDADNGAPRRQRVSHQWQKTFITNGQLANFIVVAGRRTHKG